MLCEDLRGAVVIVSGASSGIGQDCCVFLAKLGAIPRGIGRNEEGLRDTARMMKAAAPDAADFRYFIGDIADPDVCVQAVAALGPATHLVNSAGVARNAHFLAATPADFDTTFDANVKSMFFLSQAFAKALPTPTPAGCAIVNLSSQASVTALPLHAVYCASKGAVDQLTRCMALELGPMGVRVNAVNATVVLTPMGRANWGGEKGAALLDSVPVGRFAEPEDVSKVVAFLLSEAARMMSGACVAVDGGFTAVHASMRAVAASAPPR